MTIFRFIALIKTLMNLVLRCVAAELWKADEKEGVALAGKAGYFTTQCANNSPLMITPLASPTQLDKSYITIIHLFYEEEVYD